MVKVRVRPETGRLYLDIGYRGKRCKELTLLTDTPEARARVEKLAARINKDIESNSFQYSSYFPTGRNRRLFEDGQEMTSPQEVAASAAAAAAIKDVQVQLFSEFSGTWSREKQPDWRQNTRDWIQSILDTHLLPTFGLKRLDQIRREDVLAFRATLSERQHKNGRAISARTVNAVMRILKAILAEGALRFGFQNPGERVKRLKVQRKEIAPFSLDEMELILKTVRADYRPYLMVACSDLED